MNPASPVHSAKAALRSSALGRRDRLGARQRAAASARIAERVMAIIGTEVPGVMAAYLPIRSECDCRSVIDAVQARGGVIVLPAVSDPQTIVFRRYEAGMPLAAGGFGTLAPTPDQPILDPELVIVPVVAFDRSGSQLGHGRGFYDRAVERLRARGIRPKLIGVAFATQEVAAIPAEPHDARLDWIVTEKETLATASPQARR